LPESDAGLRRVSVHAGATVVDLSLPAGMPVATLIPPIVDILESRNAGRSGEPMAKRYQLALPGAAPFNASTTLAQNGIRDGATLFLSQARIPPPAPRYDDASEAMSVTLEARSWSQTQNRLATRVGGAVAASYFTALGVLALIRNTVGNNVVRHLGITAGIAALAGFIGLTSAAVAHRAYRDPIAGLVLSVIATAFAAVAGFLAVPGAPGAPNVLLAAMAAAVTSVVAARASGCGAVTLTAVSCFAMVAAVAALVSVITAAPLFAIGSVSALVSVGLLGVAPRASIVLAGLSPKLPAAPELETADPGAEFLAAKAIRADDWLASLLAAFSSSAAVGAIVTALTGAPRLDCITLGVATGALLLLRANSLDRGRALVVAIGGIVAVGTTFGLAAGRSAQHGPWIAAASATLAGTAVHFGFVAPAMSLSPILRRSVDLLEYLMLAAMVPLTCWICGLYGAARGMTPTWS
jgi:type VII secretion integral membrane protein EccD